MLNRLLTTWAFNIAAIFVASYFIEGVDYARKFWVLVLAGLVFGLVNMIVKPIVKALAMPLVLLTFGAALFFINIFMLYITSWIVGPFVIESFEDAVWGTLVIWAVNVALQLLFGIEDRGRRRR